MAIQITRWERRDNADRNALGNAALDTCRASRGVEGTRSCRFYWSSTDGIVILWEAESAQTFDQPPAADQARAAFALADLSRPVGMERWADPRTGQEAYRLSGR
jgi:hypothetical protein